jgi:hypothetical protein
VKRLGKTLLALAALLLVYLAVVAWWASASVDTLLAQHPADPSAPRLSQRQRAILLRIEDPSFFTHHGLSLADGQGVDSRLDGLQGGLQRFYGAVFDCCRKVDLGRDTMALVLDASVSKERQLALYVDGVYMGRHEGRQLRGLE